MVRCVCVCVDIFFVSLIFFFSLSVLISSFCCCITWDGYESEEDLGRERYMVKIYHMKKVIKINNIKVLKKLRTGGAYNKPIDDIQLNKGKAESIVSTIRNELKALTLISFTQYDA